MHFCLTNCQQEERVRRPLLRLESQLKVNVNRLKNYFLSGTKAQNTGPGFGNTYPELKDWSNAYSNMGT